MDPIGATKRSNFKRSFLSKQGTVIYNAKPIKNAELEVGDFRLLHEEQNAFKVYGRPDGYKYLLIDDKLKISKSSKLWLVLSTTEVSSPVKNKKHEILEKIQSIKRQVLAVEWLDTEELYKVCSSLSSDDAMGSKIHTLFHTDLQTPNFKFQVYRELSLMYLTQHLYEMLFLHYNAGINPPYRNKPNTEPKKREEVVSEDVTSRDVTAKKDSITQLFEDIMAETEA